MAGSTFYLRYYERDNVVPIGTPYDNTLETASSMADLNGQGAVITQVVESKKESTCKSY